MGEGGRRRGQQSSHSSESMTGVLEKNYEFNDNSDGAGGLNFYYCYSLDTMVRIGWWT